MKTTRCLSVLPSLLIGLALTFGSLSETRAEVKSLTLGISTSCPYGLAG